MTPTNPISNFPTFIRVLQDLTPIAEHAAEAINGAVGKPEQNDVFEVSRQRINEARSGVNRMLEWTFDAPLSAIQIGQIEQVGSYFAASAASASAALAKVPGSQQKFVNFQLVVEDLALRAKQETARTNLAAWATSAEPRELSAIMAEVLSTEPHNIVQSGCEKLTNPAEIKEFASYAAEIAPAIFAAAPEVLRDGPRPRQWLIDTIEGALSKQQVVSGTEQYWQQALASLTSAK